MIIQNCDMSIYKIELSFMKSGTHDREAARANARALRRGQPGSEVSVALPLNHLYVILDAESFRAVRDHPFLRGPFGWWEHRTTVRPDLKYTGTYFYGRHTYFEFLESGNIPGLLAGNSGLALGVEEAGGLEALMKRQPPLFPQTAGVVRRGFEDAQVPWFSEAVVTGFGDYADLRLWMMEYHQRFLAEWHATWPPASGGITRAAILERYKAILPAQPAHPLFQDVVGVTLDADPATATRLSDALVRLGYESRRDDRLTMLDGPDVTVRVRAASAPPCIRELELRLTRPPEEPFELRLGTSVLTLHTGPSATWVFA